MIIFSTRQQIQNNHNTRARQRATRRVSSALEPLANWPSSGRTSSWLVGADQRAYSTRDKRWWKPIIRVADGRLNSFGDHAHPPFYTPRSKMAFLGERTRKGCCGQRRWWQVWMLSVTCERRGQGFRVSDLCDAGVRALSPALHSWSSDAVFFLVGEVVGSNKRFCNLHCQGTRVLNMVVDLDVWMPSWCVEFWKILWWSKSDLCDLVKCIFFYLYEFIYLLFFDFLEVHQFHGISTIIKNMNHLPSCKFFIFTM